MVQHQQHADDGQVHGPGAEHQADQGGTHRGVLAQAHARFFAIFSPSNPCGRKISTMISRVKAIMSRN